MTAGADGAWSVVLRVRRLFTHLIDMPDQSVEFIEPHRRRPSEQRGFGFRQRRVVGLGLVGVSVGMGTPRNVSYHGADPGW